ncbi:hypothetical protein PtA15_4A460 [Puccinia triticina]|uniref:Uncharacterized protein n=1 Tax=Puccinia triticina TaxID=208348 RepID=A0ABY7CH64_9BASI|nr:uncharacterized protein PtA15_4A460 [Puccinia triticina]WAQ84009.1 hypothetical protein PtA15_4A460 [Puccinia triticina]
MRLRANFNFKYNSTQKTKGTLRVGFRINIPRHTHCHETKREETNRLKSLSKNSQKLRSTIFPGY